MSEEVSSGGNLLVKTVLGAIAAAVIAITPFTMGEEGTVYKAYRDPVGKPTICNGHTKGVKMGDVATEAQCQAYLREDLTEAMIYVVRYSPGIIDNEQALKASGDFVMNTWPVPFKNSPMARYFNDSEWENGCNAFIGYYTASTFRERQKPYNCRQ